MVNDEEVTSTTEYMTL